MSTQPGTLPHASAGAGEPPLVFVHGFGGSPGEWHAQLSHFAPRHLTIAVDLNGSIAARMDGDCAVASLGGAVAELIRERGLRKAVVIAHSLGCRIAIEAAAQMPTQVCALALIDGSQFPEGTESATRRQLTQGGYSSVVDLLFSAMLTPRNGASVTPAWERAARLPADVGSRVVLDFLRWDAVKQERVLSTLRVPVLALQATGRGPDGKRRLLAPGESSPYLAMIRSAAQDSRVVIVPDAGHFAHLDAPAEVNEALEAFIASLTPGDSPPPTLMGTHQ